MRLHNIVKMDILQKINFILERGTVTTDVATRLSINLIGMKYKKKKRFNKLTGTYVTIYENVKEV